MSFEVPIELTFEEFRGMANNFCEMKGLTVLPEEQVRRIYYALKKDGLGYQEIKDGLDRAARKRCFGSDLYGWIHEALSLETQNGEIKKKYDWKGCIARAKDKLRRGGTINATEYNALCRPESNMDMDSRCEKLEVVNDLVKDPVLSPTFWRLVHGATV